MTVTRGGSRLWLAVPAVAALCALVAGCGGDGRDGSPESAGAPAAGTSAGASAGAVPGTGDEYCDRLLAAMETVGQETDPSDLDFAEMAGRVVEELRGVQPYAPDTVADDLAVFIGYYEQVAAGDMADLDVGDEFVAATSAVFGECAAAPVLPPVGP